MPKINVFSPFGLRLDSKSKLRTFAPGLHDVSEQEFAHWYLQACLKQGKAVQLDDAGPAAVGGASSTPTGAAPVALLSPSVGLEDSPTTAVPTVEYTEKALSKLTNARLAEVGKDLDLSFADKATKAEMVAAILQAKAGGSPNPDESEQNTENPEQEPEKQPENTEGAE